MDILTPKDIPNYTRMCKLTKQLVDVDEKKRKLNPCIICEGSSIQEGSDGGVKDFRVHCFDCNVTFQFWNAKSFEELREVWNGIRAEERKILRKTW